MQRTTPPDVARTVPGRSGAARRQFQPTHPAGARAAPLLCTSMSSAAPDHDPPGRGGRRALRPLHARGGPSAEGRPAGAGGILRRASTTSACEDSVRAPTMNAVPATGPSTHAEDGRRRTSSSTVTAQATTTGTAGALAAHRDPRRRRSRRAHRATPHRSARGLSVTSPVRVRLRTCGDRARTGPCTAARTVRARRYAPRVPGPAPGGSPCQNPSAAAAGRERPGTPRSAAESAREHRPAHDQVGPVALCGSAPNGRGRTGRHRTRFLPGRRTACVRADVPPRIG